MKEKKREKEKNRGKKDKQRKQTNLCPGDQSLIVFLTTDYEHIRLHVQVGQGQSRLAGRQRTWHSYGYQTKPQPSFLRQLSRQTTKHFAQVSFPKSKEAGSFSFIGHFQFLITSNKDTHTLQHLLPIATLYCPVWGIQFLWKSTSRLATTTRTRSSTRTPAAALLPSQPP